MISAAGRQKINHPNGMCRPGPPIFDLAGWRISTPAVQPILATVAVYSERPDAAGRNGSA